MLLPELMELVRAGDLVHACGVGALARESAPLLGLDSTEAYIAGLLHDVGKLQVPLDILNAERDLSGAEWAQIKRHPLAGREMVDKLWPSAPVPVLLAIEGHHERLDGSGYPRGVKRLSPLTGLIAVCDVIDAMKCERPYRRTAFSLEQAVREVQRQALPRATVAAVVETVTRLARSA